MYLEVQVGNNPPHTYLLDKKELFIGSNPAVDLVLNHDEISRKHLKLIIELGKVFIVDQGSTNGSFLEGEQLIPGKRVELTPGSPVKLGTQVYINLLKEPPKTGGELKNLTGGNKVAAASQEQTRVISLKELKAKQTAEAKKKKQKLALRYKKMEETKRKKRDQARLNKAINVSLMCLVIGVAVNMLWTPVTRKLFKKPELVNQTTSAYVIDVEEDESLKQDESLLLAKDKLQELVRKSKCLNPEELAFCEVIKDLKEGHNGSLVVDKDVLFFMNEAPRELQLLEKGLLVSDYRDLLFLEFLSADFRSVYAPKYRQNNFYVVFYKLVRGTPVLSDVYAIRGRAIRPLLTNYSQEKITGPESSVKEYLNGLTTYYTKF